MPDQGTSDPSSKDIRDRESQGDMKAREAEEQGGIDEEELLRESAPEQVYHKKREAA